MTLLELTLTLTFITFLSLYTLQGWQQQRQRFELLETSQAVRDFLSQVQTIARQSQQTLSIQAGVLTAHQTWCLWVPIQRTEQSCLQAALHFTPFFPHVTLIQRTKERMPRFYGQSGHARATRLQLRNGIYCVHVILSNKGRLSLCSEKSQITGLKPCVL